MAEFADISASSARPAGGPPGSRRGDRPGGVDQSGAPRSWSPGCSATWSVAPRWQRDFRVSVAGRPPDLLASLIDGRWLDVAASIVGATSVPWLALTSAPRGPAWGALLAAGSSRAAVDTAWSSQRPAESVGLRRRGTPADERKELEQPGRRRPSTICTVVERVGKARSSVSVRCSA